MSEEQRANGETSRRLSIPKARAFRFWPVEPAAWPFEVKRMDQEAPKAPYQAMLAENERLKKEIGELNLKLASLAATVHSAINDPDVPPVFIERFAKCAGMAHGAPDAELKEAKTILAVVNQALLLQECSKDEKANHGRSAEFRRLRGKARDLFQEFHGRYSMFVNPKPVAHNG